ncbi:MAG TPA: ABC transporter permease [Blastocatellia bacterium]|nr:ABC transporter permease [Blastocatellia bacterium]
MAEADQNLATEVITGSLPEPKSGKWTHPLVELTLARVREFVRQPEAVFWVFGFPILLAFALGIAFRDTAPEKLPIAVENVSANAAETAAAISRSADLQAVVLPPAEAAQALRTGRVALVVRSATATNAGNGSSPGFDYRFDPARPDSRIARLAVDDALQRAAGRKDAAAIHEQTFTEPGARYIDFLVPGLIGLNLMGSGLWGLGFVVVQARTQKLLKRLAATPMKRWHFLLSFMLSRLVFLVLEVAAILAFAYFVFNVKIHGSLLSFMLISLIGSLAFAGIGLLIAARPRTIEGVSGLMNLVMLPMWLLSGSFFSSSRFPDFLQPLIKVLPLTALNDALRAVMNDGASLVTNAAGIAILSAWGLISFLVALKIFRWQ